MLLAIKLTVKFRAFFITFAQYEMNWSFPVPVPLPAQTLVDFSKQGVTLNVKLG